MTVAVTTAAAASLPPLRVPAPPAGPLAAGITIAGLLLALRLYPAVKLRPRPRRGRAWVLGAFELGLTLGLCACGGGNAPPADAPSAMATPAGTYTLTLTVTSGGVQEGTTQLTLVVQ